MGKSHHKVESDNEKLMILIATKVTLGMQKMLMSKKYQSLRKLLQNEITEHQAQTENISCMGGAANTSFQEVCNYLNFTNTALTSSVWIRQQ